MYHGTGQPLGVSRTVVKAYTRTLRNYVAFRGRTKRSEFWLFVLAQSLIFVIGLVLAGIHDVAGVLLALYLLGTLIPTLAAIVRRLHDTGRGFWWLPLGVGFGPVAFVLGAVGVQFMGVGFVGWMLATFVGEQGAAEELSSFFELGVALFGLGVMTGIAAGALAIILLVFLVSPGTRGENKYGPQPK